MSSQASQVSRQRLEERIFKNSIRRSEGRARWLHQDHLTTAALWHPLLPRVWWTHPQDGRLCPGHLRTQTTAHRSLGGRTLLSTPLPCTSARPTEVGLAPAGLECMEALSWGVSIKVLGWLLPAIIRPKSPFLQRHAHDWP